MPNVSRRAVATGVIAALVCLALTSLAAAQDTRYIVKFRAGRSAAG